MGCCASRDQNEIKLKPSNETRPESKKQKPNLQISTKPGEDTEKAPQPSPDLVLQPEDIEVILTDQSDSNIIFSKQNDNSLFESIQKLNCEDYPNQRLKTLYSLLPDLLEDEG